MITTKTAVGIDLGGTNIKAGVVDGNGKLLSRTSIPTDAAKGRDVVIDRMGLAAEEVRQKAGLAWNQIAALGIGTPGPLNPKTGVVAFAPNLPGWVNVPLKDIFEKRLPVRVQVGNDANVASFGEYWMGAGRGTNSMILLTLGTGIGSGVVLDGKVWEGADGMAAEIGHMTICYNGVKCACGNFGCIEAYASAPSMVRRLKEAIAAGRPSSLADKATRPDGLSARDIHQAAVAGDATAGAILEETGRFLGIACANLVNIFNPEMISFSGGMTDAGEMLFEPIRKEVKSRSFQPGSATVRVVRAALPDTAGIIGAAGCALKALETSAS
jgi:glucokinase